VRFTHDGHTGVIRFREGPLRSRVVENWCLGDVLGYLDLDLDLDARALRPGRSR
jgi:hypothetical protein